MKHNLSLSACAALLLALLVFWLPAQAQTFSFAGGGNRPLDPEEAFIIEVLSVEDGRASIGWRIAEGYYLYRDQIAAHTADGVALAVETSAGRIKDDPGFGRVEVYYDNASVLLPRAGGDVRITWQGCQEDGICYAPVTSRLSLPELAAGTVPGGFATEDPARRAGSGQVVEQVPTPVPQMELAKGKGMLAGLALRGGTGLVLLAFLGFGLALALTPCVFPMVPILAGMLARQGERLTPARGAMLSGVYVLAMAMAFAGLGAVAGWSGQNLQMVLQSPWAVGSVAVLFVLLALSSFGLFDLTLPAGLTAGLPGAGRRGSIAGAAALGFTSALIVGPCVTAPLAGAFLYIAQTGDVALGAAALFMLGLGQGVPLIVAGTFGAGVLPKAGAWMEAMRRVFGFVFLGLAIWLAARILPGPLVLALWSMLLVGMAVLLGVLDRLEVGASGFMRLLRSGGIAALIAAVLLAIGAALGGQDPLRPLAPLLARGPVRAADTLAFTPISSPAGLAAALSEGPADPAMIYVTADWCVTCKGIEGHVLPDRQVQTALGGLRLFKVDVTQLDEAGQALLRDLGAAGPPTMIFLDTALREPADTRLIGTVRPDDILRSVSLAKAVE
ncbi:protein-disulfide reductase DsbD [Allorhizobium pseudoryzae]|uniref:protein-disulfide reductase DsbD n=1 Tax=Allorhizobium pseudoryzae TaxID=379684 RepID=UPI003CFD892F